MSEPQVQVFMPKEKADELKTKYNLSDETIQDVISGLKVANIPGAAIEEEEEEAEEESASETGPEIFTKLGKGEVSMGEALIWLDYQDRKEERRKATQNIVTPEKIAEAVVKGIKEALPPPAKADDEMPPWAKKQAAQLEQITSKLMKEEEDERLNKAVEAAVKPVAEGLAKTKEELGRIQEQQGKPPKGELETTKDTLRTLQEIDDLRGKPKMPEKAKEVMIDLNEEVANALGEELKKAIVESVRERLSGTEGEAPLSATPEGKIQVNWYNLGTRALKTIEKFIEKLPVTAPPKKPVTEMPPPSKPPQLPTPPAAPPPVAPPTPPPATTPPASPTPTPPPTTETPPTPPPPPPTTAPPPAPPPIPTASPPQAETATSSPPPTEEVALATPPEEKTKPKKPQPPQEKPEKAPKTEEKPPKPSKKNEAEKEEQNKESEEQKTIIAESTTKEAVVEQKSRESGGSEETLHAGSHTEKRCREPTKSN